MPETVADPSAGPEQRVIDADTARTLRKLVDELSPRRRTLLRALFTDTPRPYAEVAHTVGIPPGSIGPTRARALQQLRYKLNEHELEPELAMTTAASRYRTPTGAENSGSSAICPERPLGSGNVPPSRPCLG